MAEELMVFGAKRVARLTGVSVRQLGYWDRTDFYQPSYEDGTPGHTSTRFYSFRDLVALRTIHKLRNEHRVSLPKMREVGERIKAAHSTPWASLRFLVAGKEIIYVDPATGAPLTNLPPNQEAMLIDVAEIANDLATRIRELHGRRAQDLGKVIQSRRIAARTPVVQGTRVPTSVIWDYHQAHYTPEQIIAQYPQLTCDDVTAAIEYERQRREKAAV